ncbi:hypothetical protein Lgra_2920 [Legionella gratiana]|uniref:Negative regulator of flagellin synthesis n=1 Tax=Legionella gratiana TaxID=45066 RepID=A0A378J7R6_9GAMM|nr:flagellar biosynthesis anti-sigma factor FlgM [Legionella gratiana]KTD06143.1 hypothetical protein Lgra_2920 [Legionella gratiana]STX42947.1 Homologous to negative regulator of flagellin synthesis FlgM (Anti-sigma-28 factor) [Legionella gratiana]
MSNQISDATVVKTIDRDNHLKIIPQEMKQLVDTPLSPINIHETSKQLEAIKNSLKEMSEINEARVLYFKAEIALGNYQIDSDRIAMRMLKEPTTVD